MFSLLSMVRKPRSEGSLEDPAALGIPQTLQTSAAGSAEERAENYGIFDDFLGQQNTASCGNVGLDSFVSCNLM